MSEMTFNMLGLFFALGLVGLAAFIILRAKQGMQVARMAMIPLTNDERLRISLARKSLEDAEKELTKAAYGTAMPGSLSGHPQVCALLHQVQDAEIKARKLLRES